MQANAKPRLGAASLSSLMNTRNRLAEQVGGDVVAEFPRLVRIQIRQYDDADSIVWVALDAAGKSLHTSSVVVEQPAKLEA